VQKGRRATSVIGRLGDCPEPTAQDEFNMQLHAGGVEEYVRFLSVPLCNLR
jgi:hypothetical protein